MTKTPEQIALAWDVMDLIDKNPEKHSQMWWNDGVPSWGISLDEMLAEGCGTTACFAGWAVLVAGGRMRGSEGYGHAVVDGKDRYIRSVAEQILGLSFSEAVDLFFNGGAGADEVREVVTDIFGPRPGGSL